MKRRASQKVLTLLVIAETILPIVGGVAGRPRSSQPTAISPLRKPVLWRDPGRVERLDFGFGPGGRAGAPKRPFVFLEELGQGHRPKIKVKDQRGRVWAVKFGVEVKSEVLASRIVWASGYFTGVNYFIARPNIRGLPATEKLQTAMREGGLDSARFQLWEEGLVSGPGWSWDDNPFIGARELQGLKILVMLTSNWDNKDARDAKDGSNTALINKKADGRPVSYYLVSDWGGSMGHWGAPFFYRDSWNCGAFAKQTNSFVLGVRDGLVEWGFRGTRDISKDITLDDVTWLLRYTGRITDAQLLRGLRSVHANPSEIECFLKSIRLRINRLQEIAGRRGQKDGRIGP